MDDRARIIGVRARRGLGTSLTALLVMALAACGGSTEVASTTRSTPAPKPKPAGVRVVAAGDIVCEPGAKVTPTECQHRATARLAARLAPDAALLLGDVQYETGAPDEWTAFDASWGQLQAPLYPAPGNHEYMTARAAGYYVRFAAGDPQHGWYAFDLGGWRIYGLNSNCSAVGCTPGTWQVDWLRGDLAKHPRPCVMAFWHHPRFSSGEHGGTPWMRTIWATLQAAGADVVLEGHDHDYERFARMTASGGVAPSGIASFVVGSGGRSLYPVIRRAHGSRKIVKDRFGVLALDLHPTSWSWRFHTIDGATPDAGSAPCR